MRKGNLIKMAAPAILSAAMMVSGLPVMAADFTSDIAVETEAQTDEFDAADDTADAFAGDEETPFVDDQAAAEDEFAATAETGYKYVYAGLTGHSTGHLREFIMLQTQLPMEQKTAMMNLTKAVSTQ